MNEAFISPEPEKPELKVVVDSVFVEKLYLLT